MKNTNDIRVKFTHDIFGTLRLIYSQGTFYYCAKDVSRILGFEGTDAIDAYCRDTKEKLHKEGEEFHFMKFIGIEDVMRLFEHSDSSFAETFILLIDDLENEFESKFIYGCDPEDDEIPCSETDEDNLKLTDYDIYLLTETIRIAIEIRILINKYACADNSINRLKSLLSGV